MRGFWKGFEKRAAAPTWLATGASRLGGKLGLIKNKAEVARQSLMNPSIVQRYKETANNPAFKAMRAASLLTLGTGGAIYGLHRLAHRDIQKVDGAPPYGMQSTGATM